MVAIHPSHVAIANEVFHAVGVGRRLLSGNDRRFRGGGREGLAAIDYEGMHIDYAHMKTAKEVIALHQELPRCKKRA